MMLDDALVFADEGRLKRMKDALQSNVGSDGSGLQLIVFSCEEATMLISPIKPLIWMQRLHESQPDSTDYT